MGSCTQTSERLKMTVPNRNALPRFELEIGNEFMRESLRRSNDWAVMLCVLATVDIGADPEPMNLIEELVQLRVGRAPEHELQSWGARTRAYLRTLIGDAPVAPALN